MLLVVKWNLEFLGGQSLARTHSKAFLKTATVAEQAEAAAVLDVLITLAILPTPPDVDALKYIKMTVSQFQVCY